MVFGKNKKSESEQNGQENFSYMDDDLKFPKFGAKKDGVESDKKDGVESGKKLEEEKDKSSFFALYKYSSSRDKALYLLGILCAVATGLLTPLNSFIFGDLADDMVDYGNQIKNGEEADPDIFLNAIRRFALYNTYIGFAMLACSYVAVTCFNYAAQNQIYIIRNKFFISVLHQDISWYDVNQSGEFASRMNEDLKKMEEGLGEKVVMFIRFLTAFIGAIILAFVKGWLLAFVCLSSLPVTMISMGIVSVVTSRLSKQELDVYAKAGNIAEEAFTAIRTVKAFEGQELESVKYESQLVHAKKLNIKRGFFSALGFGLLWFFIYASYALAFWFGVKLILEEVGKPPEDIVYTPGTMITVFFSVMMGSMSIGMASPYIEAIGIAKGASVKVFKLIEQIPTINPLNSRGKITNKEFKTIEFKNIKFSYPTRKEVQVLNGINIKIQKGETVALVGSSGCGKSTCIQLLQRFYDPDSGDILFNGDSLKELDVEWVRSKIGTVGQEPVLFGTTIAENIRYGREDATREEIEEAAKQAFAHAFVKKLPLGYDTLVGERGAQLSGGQKQRIAIARALIRKPEILLLDEATSALDTASEAKVQAVLEKASKGRTTIIVAHRLSTIRHADKIIVLNKGNVIESGTHDELMELHQEYYNLVTTQLGDLEDLTRPESATKDNIFEYKDKTNNAPEDVLEEDEDVVQEEVKILEEEDQGDVSITRIIKLNSSEWPQILTGSLASIIMGCAFPLFAIIFGDILEALSDEDPDTVRTRSNTYSMYFAITGVVVGGATFLTIYSFSIAGEKLTESSKRDPPPAGSPPSLEPSHRIRRQAKCLLRASTSRNRGELTSKPSFKMSTENGNVGVISPSRRESTDARDVMRSLERSLTEAVVSPRVNASRSSRNVPVSAAPVLVNTADVAIAAARHFSPRAVHHSPHAFDNAPPVDLATFSPRRRALSAQKQSLDVNSVRVGFGEEEGKEEEEGDGEVDTLRPDDTKPDAVNEEGFASTGGGQIKVHAEKLPSSKELEDKGDVPDDNEGCLICMDEFSARRKAYPLPCTGQCTGAYVHYRCIMAWLGQSGSCPLCRGSCDPLVLQPMQKLELQDMTKMALQPVPLDAGIIRCYVKQVYRGMFKQYGYELYLQGQIGTQEEDKFLLAARRQVRSNMTANYTICTDKECTDAKRIGRMGSNFLGTCFTLYDNGRDPQKLAKIQDAVSSEDLVVQNVLQIREELGCVTYEPNRTSVGPRKMRVVIPDVDEEGGSSKVVRPMSRQDRLVTRLSTGDMKDLMRFSNREPVFREDLGAYCLDFGGRVSMASVKNFQLISSEDPSMGNILQFGRVADDMFTMDFQWPLSPFQAFSICLSSCDTKLACV